MVMGLGSCFIAEVQSIALPLALVSTMSKSQSQPPLASVVQIKSSRQTDLGNQGAGEN